MRLIDFGENSKYVVDEIFKESKGNEEEISLINSLINMQKFSNDIKLLNDEEYNVYYQVEFDPILRNGIEEADLFKLFCQGWNLSDNKKYLIKKI